MNKSVIVYYGQLRTYKETLLDSLYSVSPIIDEVYFFIWDYELNVDVEIEIGRIMTLLPDVRYEIVCLSDEQPRNGFSTALWYNVLGLVRAIDYLEKTVGAFSSKTILRLRYDIVPEKQIYRSLIAQSDTLVSVTHEWIPSKKIGFDGLFLGFGKDLKQFSNLIGQEVLKNTLSIKSAHIFNRIPELYFYSRANDLVDIHLLFEKVQIARIDGAVSSSFGVRKNVKDVLRGIYYLLRMCKFDLVNIWKVL